MLHNVILPLVTGPLAIPLAILTSASVIGYALAVAVRAFDGGR